MIDKIAFGKKLVMLRNKCGLSQNKLSQMLNVTFQAVSKWENGLSLPDIEILYHLSQVFNVTVDYLLDDKAQVENELNQPVSQAILDTYEITKDHSKILKLLSNHLEREYIYKTANMLEDETMNLDLNIALHYKHNGKMEVIDKAVPIDILSTNSLTELSPLLSQLMMKALSSEIELQRIVPMLRCPICHSALKYNNAGENAGEAYLNCEQGHNFKILDGVVDFNTREHHGNSWSDQFRSYSEFKKFNEPLKQIENLETYKYYPVVDALVKKVTEMRPSTILDIASGMGTYIDYLLDYINWPCVIVLTDISHRILKYVKRYFEEKKYNPHMQMIYLACDARNLPIKSEALDCVTTFGGYENIMDNFAVSIGESYRILKPSGACIYEMSMLEDIAVESAQKWIELLKKDEDPDSILLLQMVYDIKGLHELNKQLGFKECSITKYIEEMPAPMTDNFPYKDEVMRWMGCGIIYSIK